MQKDKLSRVESLRAMSSGYRKPRDLLGRVLIQCDIAAVRGMWSANLSNKNFPYESELVDKLKSQGLTVEGSSQNKSWTVSWDDQ